MNISGSVNNGFIYAPRSQINISGNGRFSNGIVGNEIIISGQCDITFRKWNCLQICLNQIIPIKLKLYLVILNRMINMDN